VKGKVWVMKGKVWVMKGKVWVMKRESLGDEKGKFG